MIATLLAPVERAVPPDVAGDGWHASTALAQTPAPIVDGTPDACPTTPAAYTASGALCILEGLEACEADPLNSGQYMTISADHPRYCETESTDAATYLACDTARGYVKLISGGVCTLLKPTKCPVGAAINANECKAVTRRTWTCPTGYVPRNEFNSCYSPPAAVVGAHPACGTGAPTFALVECEDYVGSDFVRSPTSVLCSSYDTGSLATEMSESGLGNPSSITPADYWCEFDSTNLDADCHLSSPPASCSTAVAAQCLKRASETGGCDSLANTIRCRQLQADYADSNVTADDVRQDGCQPCVILPFSSIEDRCSGITDTWSEPAWMPASDTDRRPFVPENNTYVQTWVRDGLPNTLSTQTDTSTCPDPQAGRLEWTSTHTSELALANSPIVLSVHEVPVRYRVLPEAEVTPTRVRLWANVFAAVYPDDTYGAEEVIRLWPDPNSTTVYSSVYNLVDTNLQGGECIVFYLPMFSVIVEELWPDKPADETEIEDLFGDDSLDWWDNLGTTPTETTRLQQDHTAARGLDWWPNLNATERTARDALLTETVDCNTVAGETPWCRWVPPRSGYFKLTAAGAWAVKQYGSRSWTWTSTAPTYQTVVEDWLTNPLSNFTTTTGAQYLERKVTGVSKTEGVRLRYTAAEVGASSTWDAPLALPTDDSEWLYQDRATWQFQCPGFDLRVNCLGGVKNNFNYTESDSIGIIVHELQVGSRPASGP